jgi:peptidoglycan/xylan/chitin deacetylase (PgdA/CDA1 family)
MNSSNELGEQFRLEDALSLVARGHELASHTFGHVSCYAVSGAAFHAEVDHGRDALADLTGVQASSFAYPFGDVSLEIKKTLGPTVASSRGIFPGFNGPEIDLNLLKANRLQGDRKDLPQAEELISENVRRKSWLVFFTHDVRVLRSPWGCTPELLQSTAEFAVRSGSRVLTIQDALAEVGVAAVNPVRQGICS